MHLLGGANDGINRASLNAQRATDAGLFINDGNLLRFFLSFQILHLAAQQVGKFLHTFHAAGRAEIDIDFTFGDRFGIRFAAGKATLATLRLRQDAFDFFDQRIAFNLEFDRSKAECRTQHDGPEGHDGDGEKNVHYWYLSRPAKPMKASAIKPAVTMAMATPRK